MSDEEPFLARWSRRKHEEQRAAAEATQTSDDVKHADGETPTTAADSSGLGEMPAVERPAPAFDIASLPPLDSITAASDIRAFLAPGVPEELTRAALRRAWSADPAIRDFVGLAENAWDFNAPGAIAGFGPLEMTETFKRQVADLVGRSIAAPVDDKAALPPADENARSADARVDIKAESATTIAAAPVSPSEAKDQLTEPSPSFHNPNLVLVPRDKNIAAQHPSEQPDADPSPTRGPHGRALPK